MKTKKLVLGVGVNDSGYVVKKWETIGYEDGKRKQKLIWVCPYYRSWSNMIERCYSAKYQDKYPTYAGCTVATEWLTFSNFKSWMENQDWEDKQLDKDFLFKGNKIYSPETCVFVSPLVNTFTNGNGARRGEFLIGVSRDKRTGKFRTYCSNPFTKRNEHLGCFDCEQQAHQAWRKRKLELAHELAAIQTDSRVAKALIDRYSNYSCDTLTI